MKCTGLLTWLIIAVVVIGGKEKRAESAANDKGALDHFDAAKCPYNPSCAARMEKYGSSSNPSSTRGSTSNVASTE